MHYAKTTKEYLNTLLTEAGMINLAPDVRENMLATLFLKFDDFFIDEVVEHIPNDKMDAFISLLQHEPTTELIDNFLHANVPNVDSLYNSIFSHFCTAYLREVQKARQTS